jgi:hypothetical protein
MTGYWPLTFITVAAVVLIAIFVKLWGAIGFLRSGQLSLKKSLDDLTRNHESRIGSLAAIVLGRFSKSDTIEALITALYSDDKMIRQAAAETLVAIGQPALRPLAIAARTQAPQSIVTDVLMRRMSQPQLKVGTADRLILRHILRSVGLLLSSKMNGQGPQMFMADDFAEMLFREQPGRRYPALDHVSVAPAGDVGCPLLHAALRALDDIRRPQALVQRWR